MRVDARYFDGKVSAPKGVEVTVSQTEGLRVTSPRGRVLEHWPLSDLCARADAGVGHVTTITRVGGAAAVLVRDTEFVRELARLVPGLFREPLARRAIRNVGFMTAAAVGVLTVMTTVLVPATADRLASVIPVQQEVQLGEGVTDHLVTLITPDASAPICAAQPGVDALAALMKNLTQFTAIPYPALTVRVVDTDIVNALAAPGGQVLIFRGLLEFAESPDEIAAVLAHEIGHVVARDPTRLAMRSASTGAVLSLVMGDIFGGAIVATASNALVDASYSRSAEAAADAFAHDTLGRALIDVGAMGAFFRRLQDEHATQGGILRMFSTHPELEARAIAAESVAQGATFPSLSDRQWQDLLAICAETVAIADHRAADLRAR